MLVILFLVMVFTSQECSPQLVLTLCLHCAYCGLSLRDIGAISKQLTVDGQFLLLFNAANVRENYIDRGTVCQV